MYLISRENCVKKLVFAGILKVNDENIRIRFQDPDPDPLVRGMDPRILIHTKMSWIRNTNRWILHLCTWYCTRMVQVGDCQCKKITLNDLVHLGPS
jgi:hypothetical protein